MYIKNTKKFPGLRECLVALIKCIGFRVNVQMHGKVILHKVTMVIQRLCSKQLSPMIYGYDMLYLASPDRTTISMFLTSCHWFTKSSKMILPIIAFGLTDHNTPKGITSHSTYPKLATFVTTFSFLPTKNVKNSDGFKKEQEMMSN